MPTASRTSTLYPRGEALFFGLLGLVVAFAAGRAGGVASNDRHIYLLGLGILASTHVLFGSAGNPTKPAGRLPLTLTALLLGYVVFQLIPLPLSWLRVLSPARLELALALVPIDPSIRSAPLSVSPSATLTHFFLLAGYAVVFFMVRERASQSVGWPWLPIFPILAIGALEASLGLAQVASGGPEAFASGTYPNRNHFAGLLETAFPFAAMYPLALLRRHPVSTSRVCVGAVLALLLLTGILFSLSRMAFASLLGSSLLTASLALGAGTSGRKRLLVIALMAAMVLSVLLLAPDRLIRRFGQLTMAETTSEARLPVWRDTWHLIEAYPLFGCGLGGYVTAFHKYKGPTPLATVDYAHNDYLQALAELGLIGFLLIGSLIGLILIKTIRTAIRSTNPDRRCLAAACSGGLVAILIHGFADFNLYIPANALVFAWILGLSAGAPTGGHTEVTLI